MSAVLAIERIAGGLRGALIEGDRLVELIDVEDEPARIADRLFLARVRAVDPKLDAAFLDLGAAGEGFLTAKDAWHAKRSARPQKGRKRPSIAALAREGETLIVQGLREADGDKGARLTADLRLFGPVAILRPRSTRNEVSGRASKRRQSEALARADALFPEGGVALRARAFGLDDGALIDAVRSLREQWGAIEARASRSTPGPLSFERAPLDRLLEATADHVSVVHVADPTLAPALEARLSGAWAPLAIEARKRREGALFEAIGVADEIAIARSREVPLAGGGRLLIEETAACVAIDVDGRGGAPLEVDLEAAAEIALQIRLRNLGGAIFCDFVDLVDPAARRRLHEALGKALRRDPARPELHPFGPMGAALINRARRGASLSARLGRPCPACAGEGRIDSLAERSNALFAELARAGVGAHRLRLAPDLANYLKGAGAASFAKARERLRGALELEADAGLEPGGFALAKR